MSHLLSLLSVAALAFYSVIVLYIVLAGLIQASARGSAMGRWHGGWVPFRLLFSILLIMPLYTGAHWGGAQMGLLHIAKKGSDFADWLASRTVMRDLLDRYKNGDNFRVQPSLAVAQQFVDNSLISFSCLALHDELDNPNDLKPGSPGYTRWFKKAVTKCGIPLEYIDPSRSWQPATSNRAFDPATALPWASTSASIKNRTDLIVNYTIIKHNEQWFLRLYNEYLSAQASDPHITNQNIARLRRHALHDYYNSLQARLDQMLEKEYNNMANMYVQDLQNRGWMYIFTAQQDIARIGQVTQGMVNARIKQMTPELKLPASELKTDQLIRMSMTEQLKRAKEQNNHWYSDLLSGFRSSAQSGADSASKWLAETVGVQPLLDARDGKIDPMVALSRSGTALFQVGLGAWIGGKAADVLTPLPDAITDTVTSISLFVIVVGGLFLLISYLPLIFGASAILRWITHIAEMLIAAPFWAAAHAAPDGQNHTSRLAAKGYNQLLFIILFPVLVVGGYFAAIQISGVMLPFLLDFASTGILENAEKTQQFVFEPSRFIIFFVTVVIISWITIHGSYQLIETAPAAILGWISDSAPGLNPFQSAAGRTGGGIGMIFTRGARLPAPPRGRGPRGPGRTPPRGGPGAA